MESVTNNTNILNKTNVVSNTENILVDIITIQSNYIKDLYNTRRNNLYLSMEQLECYLKKYNEVLPKITSLQIKDLIMPLYNKIINDINDINNYINESNDILLDGDDNDLDDINDYISNYMKDNNMPDSIPRIKKPIYNRTSSPASYTSTLCPILLSKDMFYDMFYSVWDGCTQSEYISSYKVKTD